MKHRMLIVAGLYALGVLLGEWALQPAGWLLGAGLAVVALLFAVDRVEARCSGVVSGSSGFLGDRLGMVAGLAAAGRSCLLMILIIFVGWANFVLQTEVIYAHDLRNLVPPEGAIAKVRGELVISPNLQRSGFGERRLVRVVVESIQLEGDWQPAHGQVMIATTNQLGPAFYAGRRVEVDGVLAEPERAPAPGLFDYRQNLFRRGIFRELRTDGISKWKLVAADNPPSRPMADVFRNWAKNNLGRGMGKPDEAQELLWAMSLGWRTALTGEVAAPFMQSGTMHLFAISGLHIALVAGILVSLLRLLRLPKHWAGAVAIPLLWFYTAATGWQPSAVRATVMMTLILGAWALKRPVNVLNSLGAAAFLILLWDPQQLFRASFQLSFTVVFSLAIVLPHVSGWLEARIRPDPFLPRELWSWRRRGMLALGFWVIGGLAVSISAWLASVPLVAYHFNIFSPVALLVNVPVVLCGGLALASCLGSLLCGAWLEPVAVLFNHSAWFFMRCMMWLSEGAASLPHAWEYVRAPEPWLMFGWYALLFGLGTGWLLRPSIRRWALGASILFAGVIAWQWQADRARVQITFLPNSPIICVEAKEALLIDCGSDRAAEFTLPRHLRARGIDSISQLVLTHGVKHHLGGFEPVLKSQPLRAVYLSHAKSRSGYHRRVLAALKSEPALKKVVSAGDTVGPWKVLHPAKADDFLRSTDDVLVLKGAFHGVRILLLSDLGSDGQQAMLARDADLRAEILVMAVPDQSPPAISPGLLREISPRLIVVHDSRFPVTERAPEHFLDSLRPSGAGVVSVRDLGGLRLSIDRFGWQLENAGGVVWPEN